MAHFRVAIHLSHWNFTVSSRLAWKWRQPECEWLTNCIATYPSQQLTSHDFPALCPCFLCAHWTIQIFTSVTTGQHYSFGFHGIEDRLIIDKQLCLTLSASLVTAKEQASSVAPPP